MELVLEILAAVGLVCCFLLVGLSWFRLPETIPHHFNRAGEPDSWGGKGVLWVFPFLSLLPYLVLTGLARFPHAYTYPVRITEQNARAQYLIARSIMVWLKTECIYLFAFIAWAVARVGLGYASRFDSTWVYVPLGVIAVTVIIHVALALRMR